MLDPGKESCTLYKSKCLGAKLFDNINKAFVALLYIPAGLVNLRVPIFISPTKKQFIVIPAHRYL